MKYLLLHSAPDWLYDVHDGLTRSGLTAPGILGDATYQHAMHGRLRYYADTLGRVPDDAWVVVSDVDVAVLRPLHELLPFAEGPKAFTAMCNGPCVDPARINKQRCGNPVRIWVGKKFDFRATGQKSVP